MKKINIGQIVCLVCLLFAFILFDANSLVSHASPDEKYNFTIEYKDGQIPIEAAHFSLYKLGEIKDNKVSLSDEFKSYPIDFNDISKLNDYALSLSTYVKKDKLKASASGKIDKNGLLKLGLDKGLYLVVGDDILKDAYSYKTSPYFIRVPEDTISYPKIKKDKISKKQSQLKLIKLWKDEGNEDKRPKKIQVELYENGKFKERVSLSEDNNWQYVWDNLSPESSFFICETREENYDYDVKLEREADSFILTNIYKQRRKTIEKNPNPPDKKIPQTGQDFMPILVLAGLGVVFIGLGYIKEKRRGFNEK